MRTIRIPDKFPLLKTKRLILRSLVLDDRDAVFLNFSNGDITKFFLEKPFTNIIQADNIIEEFLAEFKQKKGITWAITCKKNNICIGTCSFIIRKENEAELGFDLAKAHWGKGIMQEALKSLIKYTLAEVGLNKIMAETLSYNIRSINLLENLNFKFDRIKKDFHCFSIQ